MDLTVAVSEKMAALDSAMGSLRESGHRLAAAQRDYQRAKNVRMFEMQAEGQTATFISGAVKGDPNVNAAMFQRDMAQVDYESDRDLVNVLKLEIRVLMNELAREYGWNQPM